MYNKHFGFEELPFSAAPDPRFFHSTAVYEDVLAGLEHGIDAKSAFIVVTGEAGTGKTTLLRRLIYCSADAVDYAFINIHPCLSFSALAHVILNELKIPRSSTDQQYLLEQLAGCVRDRFSQGRSVVLLFDEAQGLSDEVLQELPVLCNLVIESEKLIPMVLMGQPELETRLKSKKLRQIEQRITLRRRLMPFPDAEVALYIGSRLEHVGFKGNDLFEPATIDRLISRSGGIPRVINNLCDNALLLAYRAAEHRVTAAMIDEVADQLGLPERPRPANGPSSADIGLQWRFVDLATIPKQSKFDQFDDQPRFIEMAARADQDNFAQVGDQLPSFDPITSAEPESALENDIRENPADCAPVPVMEVRDGVAESLVEERADPAPSLTDEIVSQPPFVEVCSSADETTLSQSSETKEVDKALPADSAAPADTICESFGQYEPEAEPAPPEATSISDRGRSLNKSSRLALSVGAGMMLILPLVWHLGAFSPGDRAAVGLQANNHVTDPPVEARSDGASAKSPDDAKDETRIEDQRQLASLSPSASVIIAEDRDVKQADRPRKQKIAEAENTGVQRARPLSEEIYLVKAASFLRKRPAADAEIIGTLPPGTRVAVTSTSGEYFRVRSLAQKKMSGFVHKEDALFERIRK